MEKKVKKLKYNWHQTGSINDDGGAGQWWEDLTVGEEGVVTIKENIPDNGMLLWNYVVTFENGTVIRIFNPNTVEYFPEKP